MKKTGFAWFVLLVFYIAFSTAAFGQNSGWFTPYWYSHPGARAEAIAIGDVNDDGLNDVVMTTGIGDPDDSVEDKLLVYLQNSAGGLEEFIMIDLVNPPVRGSIGIGDMNGDGLNDVVVSTSRGIAVYYQDATGNLTGGVELSSPSAASSEKLRVADLNHDGFPDVVSIGWSTGDVDIFIQTGGVLAYDNTYSLTYYGYTDLEVGDLNGDGYNDILISSSNSTSNISILYQDNTNPGVFINPTYYSASFSPWGCTFGDLNNDLLNDVAVAEETVEVFYQDVGHTLTTPPTSYNISDYCNMPVLVGDVDRDSRLDVLTASSTSFDVLFQQGTGLLGGEEIYPLPYATWLNPHGVALGDINNDGWDDLVSANYNFGLVVSYGWDGREVITVQNPNGGSYEIGSSLSIRWGSFGDIDAVDISYSINGGSSWTTIQNNVDNDDGGSYYWDVPFTIPVPSDNCLIQVAKHGGGTRGVSVWPFSVVTDGENRVFVTSPNGGETLVAGATHPITWFTTGTVGNVKIEYSTDGGATWTQIVTDEPNDGSYTWTVPNTTTTQGRVRISEAADNDPTDTGDANFSILPTGSEVINVTSPNGGESLVAGSTYSITWTSVGTINQVVIEYSTDNGTNWSIIATTTNSGSYTWTVPNVPSTQCLVRVRDAADSIPSDQSNNVFAIVASGSSTVTIKTPNGGESYCIGKVADITWSTVGTVKNIRIQYSTNNGTSWKSVVNSTPNDGTYSWTIPNTPSFQCLVKISEAADGDPADVSDAVFTIVECGATITITSPKGGETWKVGLVHNITWVSGSNVGANVKIQYSTDNQATWKTVVSSTSNDGSYSWTIPNTPSTTCNVKVGDAADGTPYNISYGYFSIITGSEVPVIDLNHYNFYYASVRNSTAKTGVQTLVVDNSGSGILQWQASTFYLTPNYGSDINWLRLNNTTGVQSGKVEVSVETTGMAAGTYTGGVRVTSTNASNSPQILNVTLIIYETGIDADPFGYIETPADGAAVMSSIPVTGWALDDTGIEKVTVWRNAVPGETGQEVYIGDALLVEGQRPDVEQAYPAYPLSYKAGWGYMLLTNFLPYGGNGTFTLHVYAKAYGGRTLKLGSRTITCDNAHAVKPFGAIDTPAQGGEAYGNKYRNHGWVLTPMPNQVPVNGTTINVYVDGVSLGHPTYNQHRKDVADLFPGYANSANAGGYYDLDTTGCENGVHVISWVATDNAGNSDGIGSRYFTIQNTGYSRQTANKTNRPALPVPGTGRPRPGFAEMLNIPVDKTTPIEATLGYREGEKPVKMTADKEGMISITLPQDRRVVVNLDRPEAVEHSAYLVFRDRLRPLPVGASLDTREGIFYWQPGPASFGKYPLVFISKDRTGKSVKRQVTIQIVSK